MEDKKMEEPVPTYPPDDLGNQGNTYVIDEYWDNYFRLDLHPGAWELGSC